MIKFDVVHTHTKFYLYQLHKLKLSPNYLPIFSNIPFNKVKISDAKSNMSQINFVIFGMIHPKAPVEIFAEEMHNYFESKNISECRLILVGNSGDEKDKWISEFKKKNIKVITKGELKSEEVSYELQKATFGITTNPMFVIEKSGTVAAMLEHGLSVISVNDGSKPKLKFKQTPMLNVMSYMPGNFAHFVKKKNESSKNLSLQDIAYTFSEALELGVKKI